MPHYRRPHSRRALRRLNARQRKKYHLGEYQNLIFCVQGCLKSEYQTFAAFEQFCGKLLSFIAANGICMTSCGGAADFQIIFDTARRSVPALTAAQRQTVLEMLLSLPELAHLRAGNLIDGFYADESAYETYPEILK